MKRIFISIAIFVGLVIIAAVAAELVKTDSQMELRYIRTRNVLQYQKECVVFDPALGYRLAPGLDVPFNNQEFTTTVRTNSVGFRDDDASMSNPDVLFLGDSYVFGWGVDESADVEKQYEQLTHKKVLNMGVPGYGNIQELLILYKWAKVAPLTGKQIMLFFCTNDLYDNQNTSFNAFPYLKDHNGAIAYSQPQQDGFNEWQDAVDKWSIHSTIAQKSMLAFYALSAIKNLQVKDIYKDYETDANRVNGNKAFILVAENLASFCRQNHDSVTIVYIPPVAYYKSGNKDKSWALVSDVCRKLGFRFADLSNGLDLSDYYPLDQHWTEAGHKKAAAFLAGLQ